MLAQILLSLIAFIVITFQGVLTGLPFIAPDFQPLGTLTGSVNYLSPTIILLLGFSPIFFSLTFSATKKFLPYLLKTVGTAFGSMVLPSIILLILSFIFNFERCEASGFCVGGEPFDYMSTIFFFFSWARFILFFVVITPVIAGGVYFLQASISKFTKNNITNLPKNISLLIRVLLLVLAIVCLVFQYRQLPDLEYDSTLKNAITGAIDLPACPPYEHCNGEKMDIVSMIESAQTKEVPTELSNYQKWSLSLGDMITEMNGLPYDKLSWAPPTAPVYVKNNLKQALKDSWDITDRETTLTTLGWLANEGHSLEQYQYFHLITQNTPGLDGSAIFEEAIERAKSNPSDPESIKFLQLTDAEKKSQIDAFDYVIKNESKTGDNLIYAWDYGRMVFVIQAAHTVGYLTDKEALLLVEEVGKRVKIRFHSWEEFGDNYVVGRVWWAPRQPGLVNQTNTLYRKLMQPTGHWGKTPWEWSQI